MKKIAFWALMSLLAFTSCSKNEMDGIAEESTTREKLYDVTFNLSASITSEVIPLGTRGIGTTAIKEYSYAVFRATDSTYVTSLFAYPDKTNPTLTLKIPAGEYYISICAIAAGSLNREYFKGSRYENSNIRIPVDNEIFFTTTKFQVSPTVVHSKELILTRKSGKVEISIKDIDQTPEYVKSVYVIANLPRSLFATGKSDPSIITKTQLLSIEEWKNLKNTTFNLQNIPSACSIDFRFRDIDNKTIFSKTVSGFSIYENKLTRVKGNIFGNLVDMSIQIDDSWNSPVDEDWIAK